VPAAQGRRASAPRRKRQLVERAFIITTFTSASHDASGPPDSCECLPSRVECREEQAGRKPLRPSTNRSRRPQEARKLSEKPIENIEVVPSSDNTQE